MTPLLSISEIFHLDSFVSLLYIYNLEIFVKLLIRYLYKTGNIKQKSSIKMTLYVFVLSSNKTTLLLLTQSLLRIKWICFKTVNIILYLDRSIFMFYDLLFIKKT